MTIRNLDRLFNPSAVVLIGASARPGSIGAVMARNLTGGGFAGDIFFVNPKHTAIDGRPVYPDVDALPRAPDLAVIATPPPTVPPLIEALGRRGTRAAVVITAGFREGGGAEGERLGGEMLRAARPHLLRIVGPNCLGVMVPGVGLNASFGHVPPLPGPIAFVAQSGAVQTAVLDWATSRGIGFSHFVSVGNMADVDFGDLLDYLAADESARAVLLYMENVTQARKFMSAARAAARMKPVVVVKAGRHAEGARAAASHTGALAGADEVYEAAFQRAGMLRVMDMQALFDAVETLAMSPSFRGERLAILTNGGGMGVMATDALMDRRGRLAELAPATLARLNRALPPTWSHGNPVDMVGDAPPARYAEALAALLEDPGVDAALVLNCPSAVTSSTEAARAVADTLAAHASQARSVGIFTCWLGIDCAREARRIFAAHRIPTYDTPSDAVRGFMQMVRYRRGQEMLREVPPTIPEDFAPDVVAARRLVAQALAEGRPWLTAAAAGALLAAYRIPVVPTHQAADPDAVARIAARLKAPVALKIRSRDILHKSDVGGVALNLATPELARHAAQGMVERIRSLHPAARLEGFSLQPMVRRPQARELIVGVVDDAQFGPVILFGHGGTAVEVIQDKAIALPPLNLPLAREVMRRTRVQRLLEGYRDEPAADLEAIALTLVKVSQLVADLAEIAELDINPLLADAQGVLALDARVRVAPARTPAAQRLAIRPYPKELEETLAGPDGGALLLRPIRPEDQPALQALCDLLPEEQTPPRLPRALRLLSRDLAARVTQIDYDREMALVLSAPGAGPGAALQGVARLAADPDNERAEVAVLVRPDRTGRGLGRTLLGRLVDYARQRGIGELWGEVPAGNRAMLKLCAELGFRVARDPLAPAVRRVSLALR